jgi:hypothetical protein
MSEWLDRRRLARVKPGDGRPLAPFRWWHLLRRSLLFIELPVGDGRSSTFAVEVRHGGDAETGEIMASLYRDGYRAAEAKVPALFAVPGGYIDVRTSEAGMRRAHFVGDDGSERRLVPDPNSAEGRRMRFAREHPGASAVIGAASIALLLAGLGLNALQLAEPLSELPFIADSIGTFTSPVHLPVWLNVALGLGAAAGATERALRMRYHWLLDSGAAT